MFLFAESGIVSDLSSSDMDSQPRQDKPTLKHTGRSYLEFVKSKVFRSGGSKLSTDVS